MSAEKNKGVQEAIAIGREAINELKVQCVTKGLTQAEYVGALSSLAATICMEMSSEMIRMHRDTNSSMGLIGAKILVGMVAEGSYAAVEATAKSGAEQGPSYPHGSVKVPGVR